MVYPSKVLRLPDEELHPNSLLESLSTQGCHLEVNMLAPSSTVSFESFDAEPRMVDVRQVVDRNDIALFAVAPRSSKSFVFISLKRHDRAHITVVDGLTAT